VRRVCVSGAQPPAFFEQRELPSFDTQLMIWPVRFFTLLMMRLSVLSRFVGRAPEYVRIRL